MAAVKRSSKASDTALGGITTALIILSLYAAVIIKSNSIFFLVLSNYLSAIPYIKGRIRLGIKVYSAATILAIFVVPQKIYVIAYTITGIYPLVKLLCESRMLAVEVMLKCVYFNISMIIVFVLSDTIINTSMMSTIWPMRMKSLVIIAAAQVFFIIYDYVFSKFINYINKKF